MVQKDKFIADKFIAEKSLQKLILVLLIIFTTPLPARSGIQIPNRKNCSLIKKKQYYIITYVLDWPRVLLLINEHRLVIRSHYTMRYYTMRHYTMRYYIMR